MFFRAARETNKQLIKSAIIILIKTNRKHINASARGSFPRFSPLLLNGVIKVGCNELHARN